MIAEEANLRRAAQLKTPSGLGAEATRELTGALNVLLADFFALYLKTKNFHWHVSGPHFRDYHLLLDEQADQVFAVTDALAERVRKLGGGTLRSIGQIAKLQRVLDNDADYVSDGARPMLGSAPAAPGAARVRRRSIAGACRRRGCGEEVHRLS